MLNSPFYIIFFFFSVVTLLVQPHLWNPCFTNCWEFYICSSILQICLDILNAWFGTDWNCCRDFSHSSYWNLQRIQSCNCCYTNFFPFMYNGYCSRTGYVKLLLHFSPELISFNQLLFQWVCVRNTEPCLSEEF